MKSAKNIVNELLLVADIRIGGNRPEDIIVHDESFYSRVLRGGSLALGETYVEGLWDCKAIDVFIYKVLKADIKKHIKITPNLIVQYFKSVILNEQTTKRSKKVAKLHYDLGNEFYEKMLGKTMMYSCGYWRDAKTLDAAQRAKIDLICKKLQLKKGDRVLDIGCGWGGFGKYASKKYGLIYTGITISKEQYEYVIKNCKGLDCKFYLKDYRHITGTFDAIVSIGMAEHVGYKNYKTYIRVAHRLLKDDGKFLLHTIGGNKSVKGPDPWLGKYIFPNSMLPSIAQLGKAFEHYFVMEDWHNFGADYDKTLLEWFKRFDSTWKGDPRFYRLWKYYLLVCAGSFRARTNQLWQIVLSKNPKTGYVSVR